MTKTDPKRDFKNQKISVTVEDAEKPVSHPPREESGSADFTGESYQTFTDKEGCF